LPGIIYSLAVIGNNVFAGTEGSGMYLTTNAGGNWTSINNGISESANIPAMVVSGTSLIAASGTDGVEVSTNNGSTWTNVNSGLPVGYVANAFVISGGYIYAGTSGVWRRNLSEIIGITKITSTVPDNFALNQNYPNPFNPSTNINFSVPKSGFVRLTVYDITGREVITLVNEQLSSGTYKVDWNASNQPSGVYIYRLVAGDYSDVKKMILLK